MHRARLPNGLELAYTDQGDRAAPAIVLLPGPTDSWRTFELVLPHLPENVRAIAVSPRGHGDSDKPATGYRTEDFAADVAAFLDAVELERAVIVGHSGSTLVARRFAIDNPGRATGLVLEGSPLTLAGDESLQEVVTTIVSTLQDPLDADLVRGFLGSTTGPVPQSFMEAMVEEALKVPAHVWHEMFAGLLESDDTSELGQIDVPTLLMWGDQDGLVGVDHQDALVAAIPHAQLVIYEGVGHTPHWEDPARFAGDLGAFAARLT